MSAQPKTHLHGGNGTPTCGAKSGNVSMSPRDVTCERCKAEIKRRMANRAKERKAREQHPAGPRLVAADTPAQPDAPDPAKLTEDDAAGLLIDRNPDLTWDGAVGWHQWKDGRGWRRIGAEAIIRRARKIVTETAPLRRASRMQGVERIARALADVREGLAADTPSPWDRTTGVIGLPGGKVFENGNERHMRRDDHITRRLAATPADWHGTEWERFVNEVAGDAAGFLRRLCGYALLGDPTEQLCAILTGPGLNGKSLFLDTVLAAVGDYGTASDASHFVGRGDEHKAWLAALAGARIVTVSETPEATAWKSETLKAVTGGDTLSARFMRQNPFTFRASFVLLFALNRMPALRSVGPAIRRRLRIVRFDFAPSEPDLDLPKRLRTNLRPVVGWLLDGCREYLADGLRTPASVANATKAYLDEQDSVTRFLDSCQRGAPTAITCTRKALREAYESFCEEDGLKAVAVQTFTRAVSGADGVHETKNRGERKWLGIKP